MPQFVDMVGIEFEGGWKNPPSHFSYHSDPSVLLLEIDPASTMFHGEIASEPLRVDQIDKFVDTYYPDIFNSTCALHVHVSFMKLDYYLQLIDPKFYEFFLERFDKWGHNIQLKQFHLYWSRLQGYNNFCREQFRPLEQLEFTNKKHPKRNVRDIRFTQLNYCYSMHKTLECRLFPMFKHKYVAKAAIHEFIGCVEDYLKIAPPPEQFDLEFNIDREGEDFLLCV